MHRILILLGIVILANASALAQEEGGRPRASVWWGNGPACITKMNWNGPSRDRHRETTPASP